MSTFQYSTDPLNRSDLEYHGNAGVILTDPGQLHTDRTGLDTCTAIFTTRARNYRNFSRINAGHPIFTYINIESLTISLKGAFAVAECSYAGIPTDFTPPVYELCAGVTEEPIETHPDFVDEIAGTAKSPKNGSMWEHSGTKIWTWQGAEGVNANPKKEESGWVFKGFLPYIDGKRNEFAKIETYLESANMTWKVTENRRGNLDLSQVGKIDPAPFAPSLGGKRNWLYMGVTSTKRGNAYQIVKEWRASGRRGWNNKIYGK